MSPVNNMQVTIKEEFPVAPDSTTADRQVFVEDEDVLLHGEDGLFYFGTVVQVDNLNEKCLIQFGDETDRWSHFRELKKIRIQEDTHIPCILCKSIQSTSDNEILLCHYCRRGYHQNCHEPTIPKQYANENAIWKCSRCLEKQQVREKENGKPSDGAVNNNCKRIVKSGGSLRTLPYNIELLTWDEDHETNNENVYCYCGQDGDWYRRMLRCCRCSQWFHQGCISSLKLKMLLGDRFYLFMCSVCNDGTEEKLLRLSNEMTLEDIAHLALFNLTLDSSKKYHDLDQAIIPFLNNCWQDLKSSTEIASMSEHERRQKIMCAFWQNKNRFSCGREFKKKHTMWSLRVRAPPPLPTVLFPESLRTLQQWTNCESPSLTPWIKTTAVPITSNPAGRGKKRGRTSLSALEGNLKKKSRPSDPSFNRTLRVRQQRVSSEGSQCEEESSDDAKLATVKKKQQLPPNSEDHSGNTSSVSAAATAAETSSDETCSRGTLETFIPPPENFDGPNNPFSSLTTDFKRYTNSSLLSVRPLKTRLSEKDIRITKNGEVKRKKLVRKWKHPQQHPDMAQSLFHSDPNLSFASPRTDGKFPVPYDDPKDSVHNYFGLEERMSRGEKYVVHAKRILPKGSAQFLIEWETDKIT